MQSQCAGLINCQRQRFLDHDNVALMGSRFAGFIAMHSVCVSLAVFSAGMYEAISDWCSPSTLPQSNRGSPMKYLTLDWNSI